MKQQCFKNKKWGVGMKFSKLKKASVCFLTFCLMAQSFAGGFTTYAQEDAGVVIDATDYGADPTGEEDSAQAIWTAFEAAKDASENGTKSVFQRASIISIKITPRQGNIIRPIQTALRIPQKQSGF